MINLANILEDIEKLAYDIILSFVLVPKTLIKVIFEPDWFPEYVAQELKRKEEKRFDEYASPILFMILIALVPYIYFTIAHQPEVVVRGPAEGLIGESITFLADAHFISTVPPYQFVWGTDDHDYGFEKTEYLYSKHSFTWETPGKKLVFVSVSSSKGETRYSRPFYIQIREIGERVSDVEISSAVSQTDAPGSLFFSRLQGTSTIITVCYLLSIPVLLTLAAEMFKGYPLSRTRLKRPFYIQCYYVSPVYLALWSMALGITFFSIDSEWFLAYFVGGGFILMVFWLIAIETRFLSIERQISKRRAFAIVMVCASIITTVMFGIEFAYDQPEMFRLSMWGLFCILIIGIFSHNIIRFVKKRH